MTIEREQEKGNSIGLETLDSRVHVAMATPPTLCLENDGTQEKRPQHLSQDRIDSEVVSE